MTVGKIYAGLLIAENWKAFKASQSKMNNARGMVSLDVHNYDIRYILWAIMSEMLATRGEVSDCVILMVEKGVYLYRYVHLYAYVYAYAYLLSTIRVHNL